MKKLLKCIVRVTNSADECFRFSTIYLYFILTGMAKIILGISAFYHDSAAAFIIDGRIVAATQEERFTRIKNDQDFPIHAIEYVLQEAAITYCTPEEACLDFMRTGMDYLVAGNYLLDKKKQIKLNH